MRVAVLGGSGRIGRHIVEHALQGGHDVTVLARSADRVSVRNDALQVVEGTLDDETSLLEAVSGADVVISAIGPDRNHAAQVELLRRGMQRTIRAMRTAGVTRIVNLSGAGIRAPGERKPLADRIASRIVRVIARHVVAAKQAEYDALAASGLEWVAVRPAIVTDGPLTGDYIAGPNALRPGARISRADVAHLMLAEAMEPSHIGHPGIFVRSR